MKIRNLLLGSIVAAGLSTGAQAADLGVLTSLDVCDALGLSGLTISSDSNCLQITGEIKYEFNWGDYAPGARVVWTPSGISGAYPGGASGEFTIPQDNGLNDWRSKVDAYIKFVATADSDFGPAKAVLKIRQVWDKTTDAASASIINGGDWKDITFDEAYVSVGDATVIMAGKKGTILNKGDDEPFGWIGLFNAEKVDTGVDMNVGLQDPQKIKDGGHVIQVVSDLGNGLSVGVGLEALDQTSISQAGTAVGVLAYKGNGLTAHISLAAGGILDGNVNAYGVHAGLTGTFDNFKIRAAIAANHDNVNNFSNWNAMASAQATFDMFTITGSVEAANAYQPSKPGMSQSLGFGADVGFAVTDGVTINFGGRYFDIDTDVANTEGYQIAARLVTAVTETLKLTGEIGAYGSNGGPASLGGVLGTYENVWYGAAEMAWAPGGGFTSSVKGQVFSNGGYKATFKAAKTFQ